MSLKANNNYPGAGLFDFLRKALGGEVEKTVSQQPHASNHASNKVGSIKQQGNKDRFEMVSSRTDSPFQRASRPLTSLDPQRIAVLDQLLKMDIPKKA